MRRIIFLLPLLLIQACGSGIRIGPLTDDVVFIGDSVTQIWGNQAAFQANKKWIDKGIAGQTSGAIAARFESDVIFLHPGTVHIIAGTNDVYPGWVLCKGGNRNTCSNMQSMVETAKHYGIRVVIGTIPPWGCADDPICGLSAADETAARYERIAQLNMWLKTFAAEEGVTLVDYHAALTNAEGLHYAEGLTTDGVHPTPAGYAVMQPLVVSDLP
jgi:lysophospholipase L1-like esterase